MFTSALLTLLGCTSPTTTNVYHEYTYIYQSDEGIETIGGDDDDTTWEPVNPPSGMEPTTTPELLGFEPFAKDGAVFWYGATSQQIENINAEYEESYWGDYGPLYSVRDDEESTFVDSLLVRTPDGAVADFGKTEVSAIGQSTGAYVSATTIPNFSNDSNKYGDEYFHYPTQMDHLVLHNGSVSSLLGEPLALSIWEAAGYEVNEFAYVYMGGTPWEDSELLIPMIAVEVYKPSFCDKNPEFFGGGCKNIWEWWGTDISVASVSIINQACEMKDGCDITTLTALAQAVDANLYYPGFMQATEPYLDWPNFQTHMCLSWYAQTGDDYVHNLNNIVFIEGNDGLMRVMPFSTDINGGMAWGGAWTGMDLWGYSSLSVGCQYDPECYEETIATCNNVVDLMETVDPANTILPELYDRLANMEVPWGDDGGDGALRSPDDGKYASAYAFYSTRVDDAREELSLYTPPGVCGPWYDTGAMTDPRCEGFYSDTGGDTAPVDTADTSEESGEDTSNDSGAIDTSADTGH